MLPYAVGQACTRREGKAIESEVNGGERGKHAAFDDVTIKQP